MVEHTGRGASAFDADALRQALSGLTEGAFLNAEDCAAYRSFYHLHFPEIPHGHTMQVLEVGTERLAVQYFSPPQPVAAAIMVHGYYDHVGLYGHLLEYLLHRGVAVACFDQIGHGLSTGARATIDSFDRYVAATAAVHSAARAHFELPQREPLHWFGQSMGGAITMEMLQQQPPEQGVGQIVLFAPLVRPYAWWLNRWVFAAARHLIAERPRKITANAENPEFLALQRKDPLQAQVLPVAWVQAMVSWYHRFRTYPVSDLAPLIVQGDADRTVDWRYNLKLYQQRYPASRHLVIRHGRHHLVNESDSIRSQMWAWLDQQCSWPLH